MLVVWPLSTLTLDNKCECSVSSCACCKFVKLHLNLCNVCRVENVLIIQKPVELSLLHYNLWLRITGEGSVPEMRIWSMSLILSDLKMVYTS